MSQSVEMTQSLKDAAFEVFYKELVCKATTNTVEFVRDCIEHKLSGDMKETIRYNRIVVINRLSKPLFLLFPGTNVLTDSMIAVTTSAKM